MKLFKKFRSIGLSVCLLFITQLAFAHTWEIRVKQNVDGTLTWYGQSYHGVSQCGLTNSGVQINGVKYNWTAAFSGSQAGQTPTVLTVSPTLNRYGSSYRASYGTVTTPYISGALNVVAYSTNVCWALYSNMPVGNSTFTPPPPPVCTNFPVTGATSTLSRESDNGTPCDLSDDTATASIVVSHLICGDITGDKKFSAYLNPNGANTYLGEYAYNAGITTSIGNITVTAGQTNVIRFKDNDVFSGSHFDHTVASFAGFGDTTPPTVNLNGDATITLNQNETYTETATADDNCSATLAITGTVDTATAGVYTLTYKATDGSGNVSAEVTRTVNVLQIAPITNNTITGNQSVCLGGAFASLIGSTTKGGDGFNYTYLWESSTADSTSEYSAASGTNNTINYSPTGLTQTTWFRRTVTSVGASDISGTIEIIVNPLITVNQPDTVLENTGNTVPTISFSGTAPGVSWSNSQPDIGLASSGTGPIPSFIATNSTGEPIVATITVTPKAAAYAYITNVNDKTVSVINTATDVVVATIPVGNRPWNVAVNPNGTTVYVVNTSSSSVSVISTATNTVTATIPLKDPRAATVSPDGNTLYVCYDAYQVAVISTATNEKIGNIFLEYAGYPNGIITSPDGSKLYVADTNAMQVVVLETVDYTVLAKIPSRVSPAHLSVTPDGGTVYVTNAQSNSVSVINTATNTVIKTIGIGGLYPGANCMSPDGKTLYATGGRSNTVSVINTATNAVIKNITVDGPGGVSVTPDGTKLYVVSQNNSNIIVVNTATNTIIGTINVGANPVSEGGNFISQAQGCPGNSKTFTITINPSFPEVITKNIVVSLDESGNVSITPDQINDGSSSVSGLPELSLDIASFTCSNIGTPVKVKLTATDINGNASFATAIVTVIDTQAPTITINGDATITHNAFTTYQDLGASATDNCGTPNVSVGGDVVDVSTVGAYVITYDAVDASGNYAEQVTRTVTVVDVTPPTAIAQNVTVQLYGDGNGTITAAAVNNNSSDDSEGTLIYELDKTTFDCEDLGAGASNALQFDGSSDKIQINNLNISPSVHAALTAEAWINLSSSGGIQTVVGNDNGGYDRGIVIRNGTYHIFAGRDINTGIAPVLNQWQHVAVSWTSSEIKFFLNGQEAFTTSGESNNAGPTLTYISGPYNVNGAVDELRIWNEARTLAQIQANLNNEVDSGANLLASYHFNQGVAGGDNSGINVLEDASGNGYDGNMTGFTLNGNTSNWVEGTVSGGGNAVILTVTDAEGNFSTATAIVTVLDEILPEITAPNMISVNATSAAGAIVNYTTPVGTDNCSVTTAMTAGLADGATFPIGTTVVTYVATDGSGHTASASFNVVVVGIAPVIVVPEDITVSNDAGECDAIVNYTATETAAIPASVITYNIPPNSSFEIGTVTVTATATNAVGTSTGTFMVTVEDNTIPTVITKDKSVFLDANGNASITIADINNGSYDNCSIETLKFLTSGGDNGNQRITPVTSGTRSGRNITGINYMYGGETKTLTLSNAIKSKLVLSTLTAGSGAANRFWEANGGNMSETKALSVLGDLDLGTALQDCSDPVGVQHDVIFDTPITPGAGPEIFIVHGGLSQSIQILDTDGNVALTIASSAASSNVVIGGSNVASAFAGYFLRNNVNFQVQQSGSHGNSQNKILALDINPSEVTQIGGIRFGGGGGCNYTYEILGFQPEQLTALEIDYTCDNLGINTITLQATDASGNTSTTTTNVTVEDTIYPTITLNGAASVTHDAFTDYTDLGATATDNCSATLVTTDDINTGTPGPYTVTYTATDGSGNVTIATRTVVVQDNTNPIAIAKDITVQLNASGEAIITTDDINNGSSDDSDGTLTYELDKTSFDCDDLGSENQAIPMSVIGTTSQNTRGAHGAGYNPHISEFWYTQWRQNDTNVYRYSSDHEYLGSFNSSQDLIMQLWMDMDSETDYYTANWDASTPMNYTRIDGNGNKVWTYNNANGSFPSGISTDADYAYVLAHRGNRIDVLDKASGAFQHSINLPGSVNIFGGLVIANERIYIGGQANGWSDNPDNPQYIHQLDMEGNYLSSIDTGIVIWNTAFDGETIWVSRNSSTITGVKISEGNAYVGNSSSGGNQVTLTITDSSNNSSTATANVTVEDTIYPTITLNGAASVTHDAFTDYTDLGAIATDNCSATLVTTDDINTGTPGPYTVTYTATDGSGNVTIATRTVVVQDNTNPIAIAQDITVQLNASGEATITTDDINNGSFDDSEGTLTYSLDNSNFDCDDISLPSSVLEPNGVPSKSGFSGAGYGEGYNPNTNEFWFASSGVREIRRYDFNTGELLGSFDSPVGYGMTLNNISQISIEKGNSDYYVANGSWNKIAKVSGDSIEWTFSMGNRASGITTDDQYVYASADIPGAYGSNIGTNTIKVIDKSTGLFVRDIVLPGKYASMGGLFYANDRLYLLGKAIDWSASPNSFFAVHMIDAETGDYLGSFNNSFASNTPSRPYGHSFDGTTIWSSGGQGVLYGVKISEGNTYGGGNAVTLTVTDASNNSSTATANVTVLDEIAPEIIAPADITNIYATSAQGAVVNYTTPVGTDNCSVTTAMVSGLADGSTFPIGTTVVTYVATDGSGNDVSASFNVEVVGVAPVIVVPADITVTSDANECGTIVTFAATDATGIPNSVITYDIQPNTFFEVGTTTVTATATNAVGTSILTFDVIVQDITLPVLVGVPADMDASCDAIPDVVNPTATDNCSGNVEVHYLGEERTNGVSDNDYTLTRTWDATDVSGNHSLIGTQVIIVEDNTRPVLVGVPNNVTVQCDAIPTAAMVTATDNCDTTLTVDYSETDNTNTYGLGSITREWTVTDGSGNTTSNTQTITVTACTPVITTQTTTQSIIYGADASFTVAATGDNLTYNWQENTSSGFVDIVDGGFYSNTTTATLTITKPTVAMNSNQYRVIISAGPDATVTSVDNVTLIATKKALTVTAIDASKTYDGLAYNGGNNATYSGFVNGEDETVLGGLLAYSGTSQGAINFGSYVITPSGLTSDNYEISFIDAELTVGKKAVTVIADAQAKTYGDDNPALTAEVKGTVNEDTLDYRLATDAEQFSGVGSYPIAITLGKNANYSVTPTNSELRVGQKTVTVIADAQAKTYGDDNPALTAEVKGTVNNDGLIYKLATTAEQFSGVGSYPIAITLGKNANYSVTPTNSELRVGQKTVTVIADAQAKTYGDDNPALTAEVKGTVNNDGLIYKLATTAEQFSGVGSYPIAITLGKNANYSVTPTNSELRVGQKTVTVIADTKAKTYGDDNPALTAEVKGTVNNDGLIYKLATTAEQFSGVGSYPIAITLGKNANYSVTSTNSELRVGQKTVTVIADAKEKTYGDDNPALTAEVKGTVNEDTLDYRLATDAEQFSGVGSYPIAITLGKNANYSVTSTNSELTVGQKAVTVIADAKAKTYGDDNPALTAEVKGTVNNDGLIYKLATTAEQFSGVGSYPIAITLGKNANYSATPTNSELRVGQKTVTVIADTKAKTYGDDNPALTAEVKGTVNNDGLIYKLATTAEQFSGVGSYPIAITLGKNANYSVTPTNSELRVGQKTVTVIADAKAKTYGDDNPALTAEVKGTVNEDTLDYRLATDAEQFSGVGSYPIAITLGKNANYSVTPTNSELRVGQKTVTVIADAKEKTYGDDNPALTAEVKGTVNEDTLDYRLATDAEQFSGVGSYPIAITLGENANYSVTPTNSELRVGQKTVTVIADAKAKTYGDDNPALTAEVKGTVNNDGLIYKLATTAEQFSGVGSYPIAITLGENANYSVTPTNSELRVGQKTVTVIADAKEKTYGDDNPALTAEVKGTVNNDGLIYKLATTAEQFSGVGSYPIAITLGENANYSVTPTNSELRVGQKTVTVIADTKAKTYGDDNPALTAEVKGTVNNDGLIYKLATTAEQFSGVGSYPIAITLGKNANYSVTPTNSELRVGQKTVTVIADAQAKTYGDDNPALTAEVKGTVNNDGLIYKLATTAEQFSGVGSYPIAITLGENANYSVTPTNSELRVGQKTVTVIADAQAKTYGDDNPALTAEVKGTVNNDGLIYKLATTAEQFSGVGSYPIAITLGKNANYSVTPTNSELRVGQKTVTVIADTKAKTYGDDNPALTAEVKGTVNNDGLIYKLATTAEQFSGVGSYPIAITLGENANYSVTPTNSELRVGQKTVTVIADAQAKTYGDDNPALTAEVKGTVNNDGLIYKLATTAEQFSGVGSYPIAITLGKNANYSVTPTNSELRVGQKTVTVIADAQAKTYGDDNPALTAEVKGTVNNDGLIYKLATTAEQFSGVGSYPIAITLGENANYSVTPTNSELRVGQKTVTVIADAKAKTYGDDNPALTAEVKGTVNEDTLDYRLATDAEQFSGVGSYPIAITLGENANYSVTPTNSELRVGQKTVTVIADAKAKTYGDDNPALTAEVKGTVNNDGLIYKLATTAEQFSGVGSYPIAITLGENANYSVTPTNSELRVGQKTVTVIADAKEKTYGDDNPALTAEVKGTVNEDTLDYRLATDAEQFSGVGSYPIAITLGENANYSVTPTNSELRVGQKTVTVIADAQAKTYGDDNPALTAEVKGTVNNDGLIYKLATTAEQFSGVGSYPIAITLGENANYSVTPTNSELRVGQKTVTVIADAQAKTYGDDNPALTAEVKGTVNNDGLIYKLATTAEQFSGVGSYPIAITLGENANYSVTPTNSELRVGQKAATVTPIVSNKNCGDEDPAFIGTLNGFLRSDNVTATYSRTIGETIAGSPYTISATLTPPEVLRNYAITYNTAVFSIVDTSAPVFVETLPVDVTVECSAVPEATILTVTDNCDTLEVVYTEVRTDGTSINDYILTRTWTATDVSENSTSKTQVITVQDTTAPIAIAQDITVTLDEYGNATIRPNDVDNGSLDNCTLASSSLDITTFDCTNIGIQNTVILTVTDAAGNTDATTANVTILEHFKETLDLRSLGSFEAFTGGGAVTNSGIFRGDVGTDVGILTGFTGKDFNGAIHNNDDLTAQARIDLLKVYIHLNNILETHPGTHAPSFGSGEKLSPGVYAIGAAGSVAGTLTLDGEGDPNAVFIMKFKGAFTAGAGTNINLINGAKAANVYWIAQGALSVGANSVMKGTLFAYPGAITLGVNSSIEGRLLSSSGAVTVGVGGTATMPGSVDIAINPMVSYAPAASVDVLGSLENFSLFSSIGAVANASFSGILGDIGANVGAISGFATSVQVGSFYNGDAVTAQAKIDLDNAYTQLMLIPTTVRNHTPAFGSGEILEPGVYSTPGAGSLAGTITLDGQNNPDAIFILKFKGAFAAAAQSKVILSNGTRRCNVFWISEGASSIGSFSYMRGTVLAHGGAATMGAGGNLEGRLLSTGGAIGFSTGVVYTVIHDVECDSTPDQKTTVKDVLSNGISLFEENLKVYPNPSKGIFNIKLTNFNVQTEIYLFDTTGKLIARKSVSKENNSGSPIRIGNYNLSSGIYLVKIITKEETVTKKVIVETSH